tara:strand:- start:91 stop:201 length:111 start_codon:yes stop_codon:yes gene_type:complete
MNPFRKAEAIVYLMAVAILWTYVFTLTVFGLGPYVV